MCSKTFCKKTIPINRETLYRIAQRSCTITQIDTDFYKETSCNKTQEIFGNRIMYENNKVQNRVKWVKMLYYNRRWSVILFEIRIY